MKIATINIIVGDKQKDLMMHNSGMFESFKRHGDILSMEYEFQKSEPDLAFINRLKEQFENNGYIVTALWIAQDPKVNYVDWSVKTFSNGMNWAVLDTYLLQFGITKPEEK